MAKKSQPYFASTISTVAGRGGKQAAMREEIRERLKQMSDEQVKRLVTGVVASGTFTGLRTAMAHPAPPPYGTVIRPTPSNHAHPRTRLMVIGEDNICIKAMRVDSRFDMGLVWNLDRTTFARQWEPAD